MRGCKRFKLAILLMSVIMAIAAFGGCNDTPDPDLPPDGGSEISVVLDKNSATVDMYDTVTLSATVKGSSGNVTWQSLDGTIASVEAGVVTGVGVGETKIIAAVGEAKAECTVTVVKSSQLPSVAIGYDSINLLVGDKFDVTPVTTWKGKTVAAEYEWIAEEGKDHAKIEQGENGLYSIEAVSAGTVRYVLSASAVGEVVTASLTVTVKEPVYALAIENFTPVSDGFEYLLWREIGEVGTVKADYSVTRSGEPIDYATVTWKSSDEGIAKVSDDGTITAAKDGVVTITATVSGEGITKFDTEIVLTVKEKVFYTVNYYDASRTEILYTEEVLTGTAAQGYSGEPITLPQDENMEDGYTAVYTGYRWCAESGMPAEETLAEITEDTNIYLDYERDIVSNKPVTGTYQNLFSFNKYLAADGDMFVFRIRINGDAASTFYINDSSTWRADHDNGIGNFGQWLETSNFNKWFTVSVDLKNKTVEISDGITSAKTDKWGKTDPSDFAISLNGGLAAEIAAVNPVIHTVTYYDANGTDVLKTEYVCDGAAAEGYKFAETELGEGYKELWNSRWVTEKGGNTEADLTSVKKNLEVYFAGEKWITKTYAVTDVPDFIVLNNSYKAIHKYAEVKDGKLEFMFKVGGDDQFVGLMETTAWTTNVSSYLNKGQWYRFVLDFDSDGKCTDACVYKEDGTVLKDFADVDVSVYTFDKLYILVYTPVTSWDPLTRASEGSVEIAVKA